MSTAVVWVDSRRRASRASDSDFEVGLRETIHMSNARLRIDNVTFTDSFLTTDEGGHLFFSEGSGGLLTYTIPEGAYTGQSLAAAIQAATERMTTYSALTNSIVHDLAGAGQPWLSNKELENYAGGGWPAGAGRDDPKSLNAVLGDGTNSTTHVTWPWVRMSPDTYLFLRFLGSGAWTTTGRGGRTTSCAASPSQEVRASKWRPRPRTVFFTTCRGSPVKGPSI